MKNSVTVRDNLKDASLMTMPTGDSFSTTCLSVDQQSTAFSKPLSGLRRVVNAIIPYGGLASNCFSLASVTLGGGIISMPSSFKISGLMMAVIYLIIITVLTIYTMTLLGYAFVKTNARTME